MPMARGGTGSGVGLRERYCQSLDEWTVVMAIAMASATALQQGDHRCRRTDRCQFKAGAGNACTARLTLATHLLRQRRADRGVHRRK